MDNHTYYAVYQSGYTIFGVGSTLEEAQTDAARWMVTGEAARVHVWETGAPAGEIVGNLYARPCTKRLYHEVCNRGGDIGYTINDQREIDVLEDDI